MVGKIDIKDYVEHEDGSATIVFDCDNGAKEALISEGLLSLLEKAIDRQNLEYDVESNAEED
jgi:hypothetical protein